MNVRIVSRYTGIALLFNAFFMLISVCVSVYYGYDSSFSSLLISAIITAVVGIFPLIFVTESEEINIKEGFSITIFSWILSCIFGMLPYVMWGGEFSLINALFESVSGYTTTGSTILTKVEDLPPGLMFWRTSTHFIGGAGVVIFILLVLPVMSTFMLKMSKVEISSISKDSYKYKTKQTIRVIVLVYCGLTAVAAFMLMLAGMGFFDAVNHAFSIVATGGFSTRNSSLAAFDSFWIEFVSVVFMLLSSVHFGLLYSTVTMRSRSLFNSPVTKLFLGIVVSASLLVTLDLKLNGNVETWGEALRVAFFQVVSHQTTTGLATADTAKWPDFSMLMLMFVALVGACSGSTAGGIKADRVLIFFKSIRRHIRKQLHPNAVIPVKVGERVISTDVCYNVCIFIALYLFFVLAFSLLISFTGVDMVEAVSSSVAHMSNTGPGLGGCASMGNYMHFPAVAKFLLCVEMLIGRLEIFTFLMILSLFKKD